MSRISHEEDSCQSDSFKYVQVSESAWDVHGLGVEQSEFHHQLGGLCHLPSHTATLLHNISTRGLIKREHPTCQHSSKHSGRTHSRISWT